MQPVRKKRKQENGKPKALLIVLAALLAVAASLYFLLRPSVPAGMGETDGKTASLTLLNYDENLIERVTVHPSRTEPYTLVSADDGFRLENDPDYPLREQTVQILLHYAVHLTADEQVAEADVSAHTKQPDMSEYGLQPGVCSVDVKLTTGEEYSIALGNATPMDEVRYSAAVSGNRSVYTVTSDVMDALNVPFYMLHPVKYLSIDAELIDRVTCREGGEEPYFTAERTDMGWLLTAPFRYPLSAEKVESLLSSLENLRFSTWVGKDTPLNRHRYGFEKPSLELSLDFAPSVLTVPDEEGNEQTYDLPASNITIMKGSKYSDTASYYLYNGEIMTGTVVTFSAVNKLRWQDCISATPFIFGQNNLSEAVITVDGTETRYEIKYVERVLPNNQFETDEYGNIVYEMRVRKNGQPADAYTFSEYYAKLTALGETALLYKTESPEYLWTPIDTDVPLVSIRLTAENKTDAVTISLYSGPVGRDYLTVDGVSVFSVPRNWVSAIQECP